jgi:hypothetical protein
MVSRGTPKVALMRWYFTAGLAFSRWSNTNVLLE